MNYLSPKFADYWLISKKHKQNLNYMEARAGRVGKDYAMCKCAFMACCMGTGSQLQVSRYMLNNFLECQPAGDFECCQSAHKKLKIFSNNPLLFSGSGQPFFKLMSLRYACKSDMEPAHS
jgi:hypothetical protein